MIISPGQRCLDQAMEGLDLPVNIYQIIHVLQVLYTFKNNHRFLNWRPSQSFIPDCLPEFLVSCIHCEQCAMIPASPLVPACLADHHGPCQIPWNKLKKKHNSYQEWPLWASLPLAPYDNRLNSLISYISTLFFFEKYIELTNLWINALYKHLLSLKTKPTCSKNVTFSTWRKILP